MFGLVHCFTNAFPLCLHLSGTSLNKPGALDLGLAMRPGGRHCHSQCTWECGGTSARSPSTLLRSAKTEIRATKSCSRIAHSFTNCLANSAERLGKKRTYRPFVRSVISAISLDVISSTQ